MIPIHIDFETRSACDLKKATTHAYALHASTDVWCMAYAIGDGDVKLWKMGEPFPQDILDFVGSTSDYYFIAHNAHFELIIWNYLCVRKYGWPPLPAKRTYCTMAMAYAMSMPGSLENAANAAGLTAAKDMEGRRLMMQMAVPRRALGNDEYTWWDDETRRERLYAYCRNDVVVERELEKRLRPLSAKEREIWLLDYEINNRGVMVDIPNIKKALTTIASEKARLDDAIHTVSRGMVKGGSDIINLKDFVRLQGIAIDGVAKADIRGALNQELPDAVRHALLFRQEAAKSSTAKLKAMSEAISPDQRIRGILQYHGAGTGRWAGRKIQPQNLPRGELGLAQESVEDIMEHLDSPQYLSMLYGSPLTVISDVIRSLIIARPGHDFIAADFSAIEARVLAWLAGQQSVLDVFISGHDIYKTAAASIFGVSYENVTKLQRAVGKVAILALGYQGGVGAFQTMAKGYDVDMTPAYAPLMAVATEKQRSLSYGMWEKYVAKMEKKGLPLETSMEVFIASDLTKRLWREANPHICEYWYNLEGAAMAAVLTPKTVYEVKIPGSNSHRHVKFIKSGSFLWCKPPGGGTICYPYPSIKEMRPDWNDEDDDTTKPTLMYMGVDSRTRSWGPQKAYGGLISENVTQHVARQFLVNAMFEAEKAGYPVAFHIHDELVCEVPEDFGSVEELEQLITAPTDWGFDCPIAAEGWRGRRYRK